MVLASLRFFREFLNEPRFVGAFSPSSLRLGRAMLSGFNLAEARVIVELGPGTGALTRAIIEAAPEARLIAVERNEKFVGHLGRRFPGVSVVHACAEETPKILAAEGLPLADLIVSGLPWAAFAPDLQNCLMTSILESLRDGGGFTTFAYTAASWVPKARRFRRLLTDRFSEVRLTPIVWRNFPPAFAYQCFK